MKHDWPHAPVHRVTERGTYMVTAGTYKKAHYFDTPEKLEMLQELLFEYAEKYGWNLQAWAVLRNHYHFVAVSSQDPDSLPRLISDMHRVSATKLNALDKDAHRKVWHQFWDTRITHQKSYFARLKYVHLNPEHHQVVKSATEYPWCSAAWFEMTADGAYRNSVMRFKTDRRNVIDDFDGAL